MHSKDSTYFNIVDGTLRTHSQMDSILKSNASKGIKAYDYVVLSRNLLIIDNIQCIRNC